MQRTEDGLIVISCDFCGTDWDEVRPMIEGHHGSVICLECLKQAMPNLGAAAEPYRCTMCIIENIPVDVPRWFHPAPAPSPGLNAHAILCAKCARQAAVAFSRDPDNDWKWEEFKGRKKK